MSYHNVYNLNFLLSNGLPATTQCLGEGEKRKGRERKKYDKILQSQYIPKRMF
jgi:hypothetical protein